MATRKSKSYWPTGVRARGYTQTIGELVSNFVTGTYRMNDMQRGDTYTDKQRNDLIASVLQRIPIGEITLMKNSDDADGEFDVLDGGHRLRTLCAFCNDEFAFVSGNKANVFLRNFDGKLFSDFSKVEKRRFIGTEVSVTKLEPDDASADGARRCASAVLAKKMELGVKPMRETLAVVKRGASDPNVGRVLHAIRGAVESAVIAGYDVECDRGTDNMPKLSALLSRAERFVAGSVSSAIGKMSVAKLLGRFSPTRFSVAMDGFFQELLRCQCKRERVNRGGAPSPDEQILLLALGCAVTNTDRDKFFGEVSRAATELIYGRAKFVVRVATVIAAVKVLVFNRDDIRSEILTTARDSRTLADIHNWLQQMPSAYRSEYKAMRAEGVI